MDRKRYTATLIADLLADALEYRDAAKANMHHRVRYLAKKGYLAHGKTIDKRGTLDFPASEVYRAAIFCEFLALSMDIKVASNALLQAENFRPLFEKPASTRIDGGWRYSGGLSTAINGISAAEQWKLFVVLKRSGHSAESGLRACYTWSKESDEDVDQLFGREKAATTIIVDLSQLFKNIVPNVGQI